MKTVLSGIQSSGNLHLGNYLGSIKNWLDLQNTHRCIFGIMNLHAITVPQDPKILQQNIIDAAATYLACGLDPKKSTIFVQSDVPEHAELAWVLGTLTPMGWLNRMTQFKDKKIQLHNKLANERNNYEGDVSELVLRDRMKLEQEVEEKSYLGLFSYPVLMAADILLYRADLVPVGEDQKQHLELTRDIAGAFNRRYNTEYFKLPEPMIIKEVKRIMSLQDGTKKMSKSDESDLSRLNLEDSAETIVKKVKKAKTDSESLISYDENRPEIYNLLNIFAAMSGKAPTAIAQEYETSGYGKFKGDLAEVIVEKLGKIGQNIALYKQDQAFIKQVLRDGKEQAQAIAKKTKEEVFKIVGLN